MLTGIAFADAALWIGKGLGLFVMGTLAVLCFIFVIMAPYEIFKERRLRQKRLMKVNQLLMDNELEVTLVKALQVAVAPEYEDEGDLYMVEFEEDNILYLWDADFRLRKGFPCQTFEIYKNDYHRLTNRTVHRLGGTIAPQFIEPGLKWKYLKRYGSPAHMSTEHIRFDDLMNRFN